MKLLKFKAKNIFSLGEIEVDLKDRGLILVTGHSLDEGSSNGSGKSSIANKGILWTLFGFTAGGIKADDVLNRHGSTKNGWGEIQFESNGQTYLVHRSRGPASLYLFKGDDDVSCRKASETQQLINQAIGMDFKTFIQTYMFGQGRINSYAALPPAEQKAILEQILPTEQLATWVAYAKECITNLKNVENTVSSKLVIMESEYRTYMKNLHEVQEKSDDWAGVRESALAGALEEIVQHREVLAQRDGRLEMLKTRLAKQPDFAQEYKHLDSTIETLNGEVNDLLSQAHLANERKHQWQRAHEAALSKIISITSNTCPTCERPLTDETVAEKIRRDNEAHAIAAKEASDYALQCLNTYNTLCELRQAKIVESQKAFSAKMKLDEVQKEDNYLRVQISELSALQNEEDKYMKRAEAIASERNPFDDLIKSYGKSMCKSVESKIPLTKQLNEVLEEIEHMEHWLKVYGHDIRIKLFETVCNFLDEQTNGYLRQLKNPQLRVQFSTLKRLASGEVKEDFNVRVYSEKGGEGFDTLSGGEQQIVSFAIGKALGDLSKSQTKGSSDFQILDEPFSMLDPRNCEALVDFLGKEKGTIMLISNDENLMNLVPERLHVEKYKGITRMVSQ